MDTDMMDIDVDIDYNYEAPVERTLTTTTTEQPEDTIPAAYLESLDDVYPIPEIVNLHGVSNFGPHDPTEYAREHRDDIRVREVRWINDSSVNFEFYSREDATLALKAFTNDQNEAESLPAETGRRARPFSKLPDVVLTVRQGNTGDRKERGAAKRSEYYARNPLVRKREPRRDRERASESRIFLDYDGVGDVADNNRKESFDEGMYDDSSSTNGRNLGNDRRRNNRTRGDGYHDNRGRGIDRDRSTRNVDSYKPQPVSHQESRYGRLRGRSASPAASEDGRLGFAEDGSSLRNDYRSRSREARRRRRSPDRPQRNRDSSLTRDVWKKDRSFSFNSDKMSNHKRSDATDESALARSKGSLFDRMTKNGQPVTRPSLMSRMTKDDGELSFGRLKDDDGEPQERFVGAEPRKPSLMSRMTKGDGVNIRGAPENAFNIRGAASKGGANFSIRGAASRD
ncbi:hypothetical protein EJ04DRAFT_574720 [Polyplosphaeria fusca]|uniref:Uncharacterized protein n=1 Tax=Polyplosphaeria fusca TaxID=682080 RepID=A0A9P4V5J2_9PLEO|nr:hypothetical protein EJ04DRAFT_574720 [Polyplosphaeria fusca]